MHKIKLQILMNRTPLRTVCLLAVALAAAPALAQHAGGSGPSNHGGSDALIKGHNEQGRHTGPGTLDVTGTTGNSGNDARRDGGGKITSGGGGGGGSGGFSDVIDGVDDVLEDLLKQDAQPSDFVLPGGDWNPDRDVLGTRLDILPVGGTEVTTNGSGSTVPSPGTLLVLAGGGLAAVRRRR